MIAIAQNNDENYSLVSLDNATIITGFITTCLEVSYTRYGGSWRADNLGLLVVLLLSLDNMSWIEVDNYTFNESDRDSNVSRTFKITNSMSEPFPFDVEQGVNLYITIEYYGVNWFDAYGCRLFPLAIIVPIGIIRPWYFTIDWTVFGIFGSIFLSVFTIFLVSKYNMKQIEKEMRAKIKNEEL